MPVSGVESRMLYGASSGPALTGSGYCYDEETDLLNCIEYYSGEFTNCNQDPQIQFPIGVRCEGKMKFNKLFKGWVLQTVICLAARPLGNCSDGDLRLVNQYTPSQGILQVCTNGTWVTLCGSLSSSTATTACRQLGFEPAASGMSPS